YSDRGVTVVTDTDGVARNAFVHDRRGNLTAMVDSYGRTMRLRYDDAARVVGWTERRGGAWELAWNAEGTRPVRRTGPLEWEERFEWDDEDRIVAHHMPGGTTRFD